MASQETSDLAWYLRPFVTDCSHLKNRGIWGGQNGIEHVKDWIQFLAHNKHLMNGYYFFLLQRKGTHFPLVYTEESEKNFIPECQKKKKEKILISSAKMVIWSAQKCGGVWVMWNMFWWYVWKVISFSTDIGHCTDTEPNICICKCVSI